MLKERILRNKRTRIGRILPAAVAAVVAVFGLGSCAALEMLDSLAAEEENTVQSAPASAPSVSKPTADSSSAQEKPSAPAENSSQGEPKTSSASESDNSTPASSASPVDTIIGQIENVIDQSNAPDSSLPEASKAPTSSESTAPGTIVVPGGTAQPLPSSDSSLLTDIADSGSPADSTGDIYTPGGFTPDSSSAELGLQNASAPIPLYLAYSELVDRYAAYTAKDPAYKPEFCRYYITDIDNNGTPEILIETGTIETDRTIYVYTFDGINAELLGNFVAWHTSLGDGSGVIYTETSAMGSYIVSTITIKEGKLFTERGEQPYSESQLKMPLISYGLNDRSALEALR